MDDIQSIRCPQCRWTFKVLVERDQRLLVIDESGVVPEELGELTKPSLPRWPAHHNGDNKYSQARDVLRTTAERNREAQDMYPPNMPGHPRPTEEDV